MSKTFTSKPGYVRRPQNHRGRGSYPTTRGRGTGQIRVPNNNNGSNTRINQTVRNNNSPQRGGRAMYPTGRGRARSMDTHSPTRNPGQYAQDSENRSAQGGAPQSDALTDRIESRDSYQMIRPNERNRNQIQNQARRGEESYKQYKHDKAAKTPQYVSYSGTTGGGEISRDTARQQQQRTNSTARNDPFRRAAEAKARDRQREEQEQQRKKEEARNKTLANEARERQRQNQLEQEHARGREAWLDRLDQQKQAKKSKKILSTSAAKAYSQEEGQEERQQQQHITSGVNNDDLSHQGAAHGSSTGYIHQRALCELSRMYPYFDEEMLKDFLNNCGGNVEFAKQLLMDSEAN